MKKSFIVARGVSLRNRFMSRALSFFRRIADNPKVARIIGILHTVGVPRIVGDTKRTKTRRRR